MYAIITKLKSYLIDIKLLKPVEFDFPIINVGNLAVGGSGKTPHIEYLITFLETNFSVATLSRGYGRKTKGFREVTQYSTPTECGDEPIQIKRRFPKTNVFVSEKRVDGIIELLYNNPETDIILLDDAFQHRAIKAGLNIILTDFSKPFTVDKSMPFGKLREFPEASKRADIVIVTKCPTDISENKKLTLISKIQKFTKATILFSVIQYSDLEHFNKKSQVLSTFENILLITGLANPTQMVKYVKTKYNPTKFEHLEYRDHHNFTKKEITFFTNKFEEFAVDKKIIIVSDKDAVRLQEIIKDTNFAKLPIFILPINVVFIGDDEIKFKDKILDYVRKNQRNNNLYSQQN